MSNISQESLLNKASKDSGINKVLRVTMDLDPIHGYLVVYRETGVTSYFAFENKDGEWYIQKEVISGNETTTTYAKGDSGVAAAWTNKALETYGLPSAIFT